MRKLFTYSMYACSHHLDAAVKKAIDEAGLEYAEDFLQVLKASPLYQQRLKRMSELRVASIKYQLKEEEEKLHKLRTNQPVLD